MGPTSGLQCLWDAYPTAKWDLEYTSVDVNGVVYDVFGKHFFVNTVPLYNVQVVNINGTHFGVRCGKYRDIGRAD
ncbi:hypothetical protein DdX_16380 [Ditylenchus destructor]|uniref:Uncharacterized protein n=1 Tax=Ditylenchus destructor TaxID=166010 RepID=A0AAD4QU24_9BILA|nr:hypothetical protein DdX_16380 [Ditylenchus destructor]